MKLPDFPVPIKLTAGFLYCVLKALLKGRRNPTGSIIINEYKGVYFWCFGLETKCI